MVLDSGNEGEGSHLTDATSRHSNISIVDSQLGMLRICRCRKLYRLECDKTI